MERYTILNETMDQVKGLEIIDINYQEIDPSHNYRNLFYYKNSNNDHVIYEQDKCLNKYDINKALLKKFKDELRYSKLWTLDPNYITFDMAIELAIIGHGKYIPDKYKDLWELSILRYIAGERGFIDTKDNTPVKMNKIISESHEIIENINDYIDTFKVKNKNLIDEDMTNYINEEKRALNEEELRLNGKMEYCLDIMKDITIARTKVLQLKK